MDELTLTDIVAAASLPSGGGSKKKTTNTCRQDGCQNIVVRGKLCYKHLPLPSSTFCMPIGTATVGGGGGGIVDGVDNSIKYQDGRDKHGHKNCSHPSCENIVVQVRNRDIIIVRVGGLGAYNYIRVYVYNVHHPCGGVRVPTLRRVLFNYVAHMTCFFYHFAT